jgi:hypothetical protein
MEPTRAYLAASEMGRTRAEISHRDLQVVVENYSDREHAFGKSVVYVSTDSGRSFAPIGWEVACLSRWKTLGRDWPPHDLYLEKLDDKILQVAYVENSYDGPVNRTASYLLDKKKWNL